MPQDQTVDLYGWTKNISTLNYHRGDGLETQDPYEFQDKIEKFLNIINHLVPALKTGGNTDKIIYINGDKTISIINKTKKVYEYVVTGRNGRLELIFSNSNSRTTAIAGRFTVAI